MEQKEYWNKVSETKQFSTPFQMEEFSKYVNKADSILDVGCGYGRTLNELYSNGYRNLIGIDFSKGMIERAKNINSDIDFRVMNNSKIDLPDNSMNSVILLAVLTCIVEDKEQENLISEIHRVLKKDGVIYINDFLLNNDERNLNRYSEFKNKYNKYGVFELPEGAVCRHHDKEWIKELLKDFKKMIFKEIEYTTMNGNKSNGFYYIGKK